jgi:hypothetical protein
MVIVKHRPTFEILPSKAGGYLIVVTWQKGPENLTDSLARRLPKLGSKMMGQAGSQAAFTRTDSARAR